MRCVKQETMIEIITFYAMTIARLLHFCCCLALLHTVVMGGEKTPWAHETLLKPSQQTQKWKINDKNKPVHLIF